MPFETLSRFRKSGVRLTDVDEAVEELYSLAPEHVINAAKEFRENGLLLDEKFEIIGGSLMITRVFKDNQAHDDYLIRSNMKIIVSELRERGWIKTFIRSHEIL